MRERRVDLPLLIKSGAGLARYLSALIDLVLVFVAFQSLVPTKVMSLWVSGNAIFMLAWGSVVVTLLIVRIDERQVLHILRPISRLLLIGTMVSIVSIIWVLMPYAPSDLRLVVTMFIVGFVAAMVLSMSELQETVRMGIVAVTVSIALFFWIYGGPWSIAVVIFAVMYGISMYLLSGVFPKALRDAISARMEAETQRDSKARFLASASHDLSQPLQAARLFFDQATTAPPGAIRDKAVKSVHWAFDTTEGLLRQILEHLRLESGQVAPDIVNVQLGPMLARIAELHEPAARLADSQLIAVSCSRQVRADPALTERAIGNLVSNAIRHARAKRVLIGARRTAGRVCIWVIDDGVGVSAADVAQLFDDYVQGSDHGDQVRGGFGLGLASVRRIAELMGGCAGLEQKWVNGSAFWLELPAA